MGKLKSTGRVETHADATPEQIWAVVSDVTRIGEWSHECRSGVWLDDACAAAPGVRYSGFNRVGKVKWSRTNEIVAADAPHQLVWRTIATRMFPDSTEWSITLEPEGNGTKIVQSYRILKLNPVMDRLIYLTTPTHRDRMPALEGDLRRLGEVAAQAATA